MRNVAAILMSGAFAVAVLGGPAAAQQRDTPAINQRIDLEIAKAKRDPAYRGGVKRAELRSPGRLRLSMHGGSRTVLINETHPKLGQDDALRQWHFQEVFDNGTVRRVTRLVDSKDPLPKLVRSRHEVLAPLPVGTLIKVGTHVMTVTKRSMGLPPGTARLVRMDIASNVPGMMGPMGSLAYYGRQIQVDTAKVKYVDLSVGRRPIRMPLPR